jgi:ATP-binding cassette subfamily B protein
MPEPRAAADASPHDEDALGKAYDARLMRRLVGYLRPHRALVGVSVLLLFALSLLELAGPFLTKIAIDDHILRRDPRGLALIALAYLAVLALSFLIRYAQTLTMSLTGQRIMRDLRLRLFRHVLGLPVSFFDRNPVGRLMTRLTNDVEVLNEMFTSGLVTIIGDVVTLAGIMGLMLAIDWRMALVAFSVLPLLLVATSVFRKRVRDSYRQIRTRIARINSSLQENITGIRVVQLMNSEDRSFSRFDRLNQEHRDAYFRTILAYAVFYPVVELLSSAAIALLVVYGGGRVLGGAATFGALVAFIQYAQRFFRPIRDLSEKYNVMQSAMASSERIFALLDVAPGVTDPPRPVAPPPALGAVEFRDVWFAYRGEDWVLKGVSFRAQPGETLAFVGATGAGKTTIASLLCRFYDPQRGAILIDGTDIRVMSQSDLRGRLAIVHQDVFLFAGSVTENIAFARGARARETAVHAARAVHAHRFIERIPNGYDGELTERGGTLSAGERQLMSFARALAAGAPILVLDEATSSVDMETEALIQQALRTLIKGRTSLIIAHRLTTIQRADRIIVLHRGSVREEGTHAELLARGGLYGRLHQLQFGAGEAPGAPAPDAAPTDDRASR